MNSLIWEFGKVRESSETKLTAVFTIKKWHTIPRHTDLHCDLECVIKLAHVAGIGFKEHGQEWLEQQSQFEKLLAELGNSHDAAVSDKGNESLEYRSQQSRARVQ